MKKFDHVKTNITLWILSPVVAVAFLLLTAGVALALKAPAGGGFAGDIYTIVITNILKGPIGFVAGMVAIVYGAILAIQQRITGAIPALVGGAMLAKADSIAQSMGLLF